MLVRLRDLTLRRDLRTAAAARGAGAGLVARASTLLGLLLAVPLVVQTLGVQGFATYALITGLAVLVPVADLGVGSGLVTAVGRDFGRGDVGAARRHVASGALLLALIGCAITAGSPWLAAAAARLLAIEASPDAVVALTTWFIVAGINVPASLGGRVLTGMQRTGAANLWVAAGPAISLAGLVIVAVTRPTLLTFVVAASVGPLIAGLSSLVWAFAGPARHLVPSPSGVRVVEMRDLLHLGGLFFVLTVASAVALQSDPVVLSWTLGEAAVAEYAATYRVFLIPLGLASALYMPLWPAFAEAWARQAVTWVSETFQRAKRSTWRLGLPVTAVIGLLAAPTVRRMTDGSITPSLSLVVALALWSLLVFVNAPYAMLLNGLGVVRFQLMAASAMAAVNVPASIFLAHSIGVAGPAWASLAAHFCCAFVPTLVLVRRTLPMAETSRKEV